MIRRHTFLFLHNVTHTKLNIDNLLMNVHTLDEFVFFLVLSNIIYDMWDLHIPDIYDF